MSVEEIQAAYRAAADGPLKGYLKYTDAPIVSTDIVTDPASCIFDSGLTKVIGNQVKVVGWYDNEWGYSNRLVDITAPGRVEALRGPREDSRRPRRRGRVRAHRAGALGPQRPPRRHDGSPTTAGSAPRVPTIRDPARRRCPGRRRRPPRPPEAGCGQREVLARPGRGPAGRAARHRGHPRAATATRPPPRPERWPTAASCCWRTSASTRGRPARTPPSGPRSPPSWRRWPARPGRSSPTGSASCTASRPRSTTSRSSCPPTPAGWCAARSRCCAGSPRPGAALRGGARRVEGVGQAAGHRVAAAAGRLAAGRWRDVLHLPRGAGARCG